MIRPMLPAARCFVPVHPQPHATVPRRRSPAATTTVSAKPRRWTRGPRRDRSWDDDGGGGGSDSDADDGFFGQEPDDGDDDPELAPGRSASPFAAPAGGQLRGSDVLRALQRAAAAKEAARRKKDKRPAPAPRRGGEKLKPVGGDVEAGEVRPVVIRPEWAARIRELEGRVLQLADKYHHHR